MYVDGCDLLNAVIYRSRIVEDEETVIMFPVFLTCNGVKCKLGGWSALSRRGNGGKSWDAASKALLEVLGVLGISARLSWMHDDDEWFRGRRLLYIEGGK